MKKVLLCIMDGVGIRKNELGNAYLNANTPTLDYLWDNYPHIELEASGEFVGLPKEQMGNSEVGHSTIGSGRILYQSLELINKEIENKSIYNNKNILKAIEHVKKNSSKLHLIGLLSDGGIHSHINHLFTLLDICKEKNFENVYIHIITDGRDTNPDSGIKYIKMLEDKINDMGIGKIATLCGRYYMMDRDDNYDRVKLAYDMLTKGMGEEYNSPLQAWEDNQNKNITDEFMLPSIINIDGLVRENDSIITFNFRPDRLRELYTVFTNDKFNNFERELINNLLVVTMMPVSSDVRCINAFNNQDVNNTLGSYLSSIGYSQLRIAETEKYAHVTYFFDGGKNIDLNNCKKVLISSPKVKTYDLMPEMSAYKITDSLLEEANNNYDLIVLNFANGDMVGHTGVYEKGIAAMDTVDNCINKIISELSDKYTIIITADHGNCEQMINDDGTVNTQHTTNKVPFIIVDKTIRLDKNITGSLCDIAPTILKLMNVEVPKEMTGSVLITSSREV